MPDIIVAIATSAASLIEGKLHIATCNIVEFKLHISKALILLNYRLSQKLNDARGNEKTNFLYFMYQGQFCNFLIF